MCTQAGTRLAAGALHCVLVRAIYVQGVVICTNL